MHVGVKLHKMRLAAGLHPFGEYSALPNPLAVIGKGREVSEGRGRKG